MKPILTEQLVVDAINDDTTPDTIKLLLADLWVETQEARREADRLARALTSGESPGQRQARTVGHPSYAPIGPDLTGVA
jgi:hypothetical protein